MKDDNNELVTVGNTGEVLFWNMNGDEPTLDIPLSGTFNTIKVSPSGKFIAIGGEELIIFELFNIQLLCRVWAHLGDI